MAARRPSPSFWGRCIAPGHWFIAGHDVRAVYQGRSRAILEWTIDGTHRGFLYLDDARNWIENHGTEQETMTGGE